MPTPTLSAIFNDYAGSNPAQQPVAPLATITMGQNHAAPTMLIADRPADTQPQSVTAEASVIAPTAGPVSDQVATHSSDQLAVTPGVVTDGATSVDTSVAPVGEPALIPLPDMNAGQNNELRKVPILLDELDPNWSLENTWEIDYLLNSRTFTRDNESVLAATPRRDFGALFFTVRPESTVAYTREQVYGISFWISGGRNPIYSDDLGISIIGSNYYPYWRSDDRSVRPMAENDPEWPLFSETRLYYLGISEMIPENTWVEIVVWIDEREFDPEYKYITGFYIKNDSGFRDTLYIDDVNLLVLDVPTP
ncbi:MAG: hypothetical protein HC828_20195 [Blastochloris sp.]|nr:hypothetical protein [Blastochloris sp.]